MKTYEFGKSDTVLIQPVGKHELPWIENEVREIHRLTSAISNISQWKLMTGTMIFRRGRLRLYLRMTILVEAQLKRWRKY